MPLTSSLSRLCVGLLATFLSSAATSGIDQASSVAIRRTLLLIRCLAPWCFPHLRSWTARRNGALAALACFDLEEACHRVAFGVERRLVGAHQSCAHPLTVRFADRDLAHGRRLDWRRIIRRPPAPRLPHRRSYRSASPIARGCAAGGRRGRRAISPPRPGGRGGRPDWRR